MYFEVSSPAVIRRNSLKYVLTYRDFEGILHPRTPLFFLSFDP